MQQNGAGSNPRVPTRRPSKQTAEAAAEHKHEMSSLNLNLSLQAWLGYRAAADSRLRDSASPIRDLRAPTTHKLKLPYLSSYSANKDFCIGSKTNLNLDRFSEIT